MAGNSQRRGAMRKSGTKKGMVVGSGGQRRKALKGKGPTPKAEERTSHPAARRAKAAAKRDAKTSKGSTTRSGSSRDRRSRSRDVLMGRNPVVEALRAGVPASSLQVQQFIDSDDRVREAISLAADQGLPLLEVTRNELDRIADGGVHQGLVLTVPTYDYLEVPDLLDQAIEGSGLLIALDGVTDPRNLGAVARSAGAFAAAGVIIPERRAAGVTAAAWKASAGALSRVPVARATNLTRALVAAQKAGFMVVGLAADGDVDLASLDPEIASGPLVIVVGSEGRGLSRLVADTCDFLVSIPMVDEQESLNASVAAAITLYAVASVRSG